MSKWFYELQEKGLKIGIEYKEHLYDSKSSFQKIDVYKTIEFGNLLTLDGLIMTTEKDEIYYHEMMVHPALFTHPAPEKVLVIGGGDGGTLREVLKHKRVREGDTCEIDEQVIQVSKKYLPNLAVSFNHPKAKVFIEDGFRFLDDHIDTYSVIIIDSTDPIGEAAKLFEKEFIEKVFKSLKKDGIMIMQCENPFYQFHVMKKMYSVLKSLFKRVFFYFSPVPTYPSGQWAYIMGSKKYHPIKDFQDKYWEKKNFKTRYYNKEIHYAAFAAPEYIKKEFENC